MVPFRPYLAPGTPVMTLIAPFVAALLAQIRCIARAFRRALSPLLLAGSVVALSAQTKDPNLIVTEWLSAQTNIHSWSAQFTQTRSLKALTQPLIAQGRVWFIAPNRFRWELGQPPQTVALRQPDHLLVIYPRLKRVERYPLTDRATGPWRDALALFEAGFPRGQSDLDAKFRLLFQTQTNDLVQLDLEPRSSSARRMISKIQVVFSTTDFALRATELEFSDGSTLRNEFSSIEVNPEIPPELFEFQTPPGYKVVQPR